MDSRTEISGIDKNYSKEIQLPILSKLKWKPYLLVSTSDITHVPQLSMLAAVSPEGLKSKPEAKLTSCKT